MCRRRLQRGGDIGTIAQPFDGDARLVEVNGKIPSPKLPDQRRAEGDGGMAAEGNFRFRREIADPPAICRPVRQKRFPRTRLRPRSAASRLHWAGHRLSPLQRDCRRHCHRKGRDLQDVHLLTPRAPRRAGDTVPDDFENRTKSTRSRDWTDEVSCRSPCHAAPDDRHLMRPCE